MNSTIARRTAIAALLSVSLAAGSTLTVPALAASVSVIVNGQQISFDQPPIERAGRVFVPLRGVFEHLGASVVYSNGVINATGNGRNISLRIGSTQATVNGQTQYLDVAPFLVGARTLVPLRFVAQALGASVDWNNNTSTVTITGGNGGNNPPAQNTPPPNRSFYLRDQRPAVNGSVGTLTPAIHAAFSEPVAQNSVRVSIDGRDVTNDVYINANGFDVTPSFQLPAGTHHVRVTGTTQAGATFARGWAFNTGGTSMQNYIRNVQPAPNGRVTSSFNFSGRTIPGSQVRIVASGQANVFGGIFQVGTGAYQTTATADGNGVFSAAITLNNVSGSQVRVLVQSVAPNGSSVERSFTYSM
ncbi:MAG TPA: copper amine oxidase N-terminal domain-containing protein [Candidatus Aquilonibacter sp.]|nr:copper amine oxidase N-terminal domain-containing protein [Candidatus Aquilonibacter sp.]